MATSHYKGCYINIMMSIAHVHEDTLGDAMLVNGLGAFFWDTSGMAASKKLIEAAFWG